MRVTHIGIVPESNLINKDCIMAAKKTEDTNPIAAALAASLAKATATPTVEKNEQPEAPEISTVDGTIDLSTVKALTERDDRDARDELREKTGGQLPSIGRVVHYWSGHPNGKPCAATIADVHEGGCVTLSVINHHGYVQPVERVWFGTLPLQWSWPARV